MLDETYISISNIDINEKVIDSYDKKQVVTNIFEYDIDEDIIELTLEDDRMIRCTKDHLFLTKDGWVEAKDLTEDHDLIEI